MRNGKKKKKIISAACIIVVGLLIGWSIYVQLEKPGISDNKEYKA